jgi:hypothetical protein
MVGPYNTIDIEAKAVALIDFETAAPGPRIWDLAFAVYRFFRHGVIAIVRHARKLGRCL